MFTFSQESLLFPQDFQSFMIFPSLYQLSHDFKNPFSSEFPEKLTFIFFLRDSFQLQSFPSIHHVFPSCIFQNLIAHAWILCAYRVEHDFDDLTKSSTILVLGSITPVKGGRNGRTSYRQVEPHPMDFPAIFKTEASISKHFPKSGQVWSAKAFSLSLFRKEGKTGEKFRDDNRFGDRDGTCPCLIRIMLDLVQLSKLCSQNVSSFTFNIMWA